MSFLSKVNVVRRRITRGVTKNIGKSYTNTIINTDDKVEIKRILICRPNHRLGNILLITPLIQEVVSAFPECEIEILVKGGLSPIILKNYQNVTSTIELPRKPFRYLLKYIIVFLSVKTRKYDLAINTVDGSSSGKLLTSLANSKHKIFGEVSAVTKLENKDHVHMAKSSVYNFRNYLKSSGHSVTNTEVPVLDLKLDMQELADGYEVLKSLIKNEKKTICIFTNATGAKCYSEEWWLEFYEELKSVYSEYNIIEILPVENISKIGFKAPSFYSKELRDIAALVANTELFIGADSGVMHLAVSAQIPTVGLFSVTDYRRYGPYGANNTSIYTGNKSIVDCIEVVKTIIPKHKKNEVKV